MKNRYLRRIDTMGIMGECLLTIKPPKAVLTVGMSLA